MAKISNSSKPSEHKRRRAQQPAIEEPTSERERVAATKLAKRKK